MATLWLPAALLGAATKADQGLAQRHLFLTILILAGALFLGAAILKLVDRWRKRTDDALSTKDQLAHFQQLHWRGELSKEEFERIQSVLGERVRQEEAPASPAAEPNSPNKPGTPQPPETGIQPQPPG
jgi:hypothetical protein